MSKQESTKQNKKRDKSLIYLIIMIILVLVLIGALGTMIYQQWKQNQAEDQVEEMRSEPETEIVIEIAPETETLSEVETETETEEVLTVSIPQLNLDWDSIWAENEDIYAWIYIPNTNVDYPVLQHPTEDSYYLSHNLDGSSGYPGCIYTHLANSKDFSDRLTVVYGHNMKNGTMFRTLHYFEEEDFFEENPYIFIYLPDGEVIVYEIFSAGQFNNKDIIKKYGANSSEGLRQYLQDLEDARVMSTHVRSELTVDHLTDRVLVLSTCMGDSSKRYLVQGVLIYEGVPSESAYASTDTEVTEE